MRGAGLSRHARAHLRAGSRARRGRMVAASAQKLLETFDREFPSAACWPATAIAISASPGGIFANVRLNQRLAEEMPVDEVFVYPGDERPGPGRRRGAGFPAPSATGSRIGWKTALPAGESRSRPRLRPSASTSGWAAIRLSGGTRPRLGGDGGRAAGRVASHRRHLYPGYGIRPARAGGPHHHGLCPPMPEINRILNDRLTRSEFMPFAPVVTAEDAEDRLRSRPGHPLCRAIYDHHLPRA